MELHLETAGLDLDAWSLDFVRSTVAAAVRYHETPVRVWARFEAAPAGAVRGGVHCVLWAEPQGARAIAVSASQADLCGAVQTACDRLEVALHVARAAGTSASPKPLAA